MKNQDIKFQFKLIFSNLLMVTILLTIGIRFLIILLIVEMTYLSHYHGQYEFI